MLMLYYVEKVKYFADTIKIPNQLMLSKRETILGGPDLIELTLSKKL